MSPSVQSWWTRRKFYRACCQRLLSEARHPRQVENAESSTVGERGTDPLHHLPSSGSIVIESIFALPGVGHLAWISLQRSDFTVVQGIVLMLSVIYILMALVADLFNAWLDPRIRVA